MDAFFAWQQNYIDSGFKKHGSGVCWDWIESGQCPSLQSGLPCRHKHPKITLRSDGQGGCEASLSTKVPHWVKLLNHLLTQYLISRQLKIPSFIAKEFHVFQRVRRAHACHTNSYRDLMLRASKLQKTPHREAEIDCYKLTDLEGCLGPAAEAEP